MLFFVEVGGYATPPCVTHPQTPSCEGACRYAPLSTTKAALLLIAFSKFSKFSKFSLLCNLHPEGYQGADRIKGC